MHVHWHMPTNKAREWKRNPTSPQITHTALPLDRKVSHFLWRPHEFKFGSNFSWWDISCFAINAENSQKPAKKEHGNRQQKSKFSSGQGLPSQPWASPRNFVFQPAKTRYHVDTPGTLADCGGDSSVIRSSLSSSFLGRTYRSGSEAATDSTAMSPLWSSVSRWICEFVQSKQHRDAKWTHTCTLYTDVHSIKTVLGDTEIHIKELCKQQKDHVSQKCLCRPIKLERFRAQDLGGRGSRIMNSRPVWATLYPVTSNICNII